VIFERLSEPDRLAETPGRMGDTAVEMPGRVDSLVVSGGGSRNPVLMRRITALLPDTQVVDSGELGVPPDAREAVAFALIGWDTLHGLPGNVASCTGAAGPRVLGRITPASSDGLPESSRLDSGPVRVTFTNAGSGDTKT
jgi:anhydro-N-acetylmuramic acid kinase